MEKEYNFNETNKEESSENPLWEAVKKFADLDSFENFSVAEVNIKNGSMKIYKKKPDTKYGSLN